jgi:hypothetical protein
VGRAYGSSDQAPRNEVGTELGGIVAHPIERTRLIPSSLCYGLHLLDARRQLDPSVGTGKYDSHVPPYLKKYAIGFE